MTKTEIIYEKNNNNNSFKKVHFYSYLKITFSNFYFKPQRTFYGRDLDSNALFRKGVDFHLASFAFFFTFDCIDILRNGADSVTVSQIIIMMMNTVCNKKWNVFFGRHIQFRTA